MATFRETAAHSVLRLFVMLVVSCFGFECGIWDLIAPVPGHCILVTFSRPYLLKARNINLAHYFSIINSHF